MPKESQQTAWLMERIVVALLFVGLLVGVALVLRPFVTAFLFGGIIFIATSPIRGWLLHRGLPNGMVAIILTAVAVALIIVPLVVLTPRLAAQLTEVARHLQDYLGDTPKPPNWLTRTPFIGPRIEQLWDSLARGRIQDFLTPYSATLRKFLIDLGSALAEGVLQTILSLAIAAMLWLRGDALKRLLEEIGERLAGSFGHELLHAAAASVKGVAYGIVGTALIQAALLTAGLLAAGIPAAGVLGFLALLIALSQIGILLAVIWGGAAWWLFSNSNDGWAIFMIVWGLFVSSIDNVIRPLLVGLGATMPITLVFLGVLGGFITFGFLGMFIGPSLLAVSLALLKAWQRPPKRTVAAPSTRGNSPR
jgi:predicted PurR-regulated permease PerM